MLSLFKQDVQRWVIPQSIADPSEVTLSTTLKLLWRHMPLRAMLWFRFGSWCKQKGISFLPGFVQRYLYRFFGFDISIGNEVGGGFYIAHPNGTVINAKKIGANCSIIASVTIGMRNEWQFPEIGDNVFIGAGARILGGIRIEDGAKIGANAVVLDDVPAGSTAVGIPAKVILPK
jgi:serine O-acetyltransferase